MPNRLGQVGYKRIQYTTLASSVRYVGGVAYTSTKYVGGVAHAQLTINRSKKDRKDQESTQSSTTLIIGIAPITKLRTYVIKIVTFKGGHLVW